MSMSASPLALVTLGAALGAGLIAGVFFAFSAFVMTALSRLPAAQGVAAMQSINVAVVSRWFMGTFLGTAIACLVLAASSLLDWSAPGATLRLGGAALYLIGIILVTGACNVPLNDSLASVSPESAEAASLWPRYVEVWTRWNHVRTAAGLASAAALIGALRAAP